MPNPVKLIDILSENTAAESVHCDDCRGSGQIQVPDQDTGFDLSECEACMGTGYNQLGLILQGILQPPPEGYGPVELKEALDRFLEESSKQQMIQETQLAIAQAQQVILETQQMIARAQELIAQKETLRRVRQPERQRKIS